MAEATTNQGHVDQAEHGLAMPANPEQWVAQIGKPGWDQYFMALVFVAAMRSPDRQTKQGCMVVDWNTKSILGTGYNGHPVGSRPVLGPGGGQLPVYRAGTALPDGQVQGTPDKYACMAHADMNAAIQAASRGPVEHAVVYLPMPPCENCLLVLTNLRLAGIQVKRIVYLENRDFPNTNWLMKFIPHVVLQPYAGPNPLDVLMNAAIYMKLRQEVPDKLSANSAKTYSGGS